MKAKHFLIGVSAIAGLAGAATLDRAPAIPVSTPDAQTASDARALFDRLREAGPGFQPIVASAVEVSAAGTLAGRAAGFDRTRTALEEGAVVARASIPAWLGLWLNPELRIAPGEKGGAAISGTIGWLPVPEWLANIGVWSLRRWMAARGQEVPEIGGLIRDLRVNRGIVSAQVKTPRNGVAIAGLARAGTATIDGTATAAAYCRLVVAQRGGDIADLAGLTQAAFSSGDGEANRATLVAVAMVAVSPKVARLAGPGVEAALRCGSPTGPVTLHGRTDLAKHWALSAALAAAFGPDASGVAGVWKELSDSADGGSGFSYVDLAADRAGTLIGDRASGPETAAGIAQWLKTATESDLLPVSQLALAEGMSEAAFVRRYGALDDARHRATVSRIDSVIVKNLPR